MAFEIIKLTYLLINDTFANGKSSVVHIMQV